MNNDISYRVIGNNKSVEIAGSYVPINTVLKSVNDMRNLIKKFNEFEINISEILGLRNLSGFIGELFAHCIRKNSNGLFIKNPHQDGYPDLLLMNQKGKYIYRKLSKRLKEKAPFSPFENGGIEVKATIGAVPTPKMCAKKGLDKPDLGDQRIHLLTGYDWKAHHQETNYLLGLLWDFIEGFPTIVAVFYSNNLELNDWGKIVKPKTGGGRTTSVSIMTRIGIKKMYDNILLVIDDQRYIDFLNGYNKSDKL